MSKLSKSEQSVNPGKSVIQTNIPELRFSEYIEPWIEKTLNDIASFKKGKGISKADIVEDGNLECIRYGELYTTYSEVINKIKSKTDIPPESLILSEYNDVIIPASGESNLDIATASCVLKKGVAYSGDLNIIKSDLNGVFLAYYLNNKKKKDIVSLAQGVSVVHLYSSQLKSLKLNLPSLPEQEKIASFLSAVDRKIELLRRKKELLEEYKKGVMQKLFSQEIRFKQDDGTDFPDWEEKMLGDLSEIVGGGTPETENPEYWNGNIQWFTPTEIRSKFISNSKRTISELGLRNSSAKLLPKGTILFTSRATIAELGYAINECTTNQGFQSLIVNQHNVSEFVYHLIKINKYQFVRKSQGSTFLEISSKEMKKMKFTVPSYPEQQKIATYLFSLDSKIECIEQQITHSQTFKKGLLQKMFV